VRQSRRAPAEAYVRRSDPRGRLYFWIGGDKSRHQSFEPDTDRTALSEGWATVTPLRADLTDEQALGVLSGFDWTGMLKDYSR
jgi:5'-nucleotidase